MEGKYGLIRNPKDQFWSYFIEPENPLKFDCAASHEKLEDYLYIANVESLQLIVNLMSMKALTHLPVKI